MLYILLSLYFTCPVIALHFLQSLPHAISTMMKSVQVQSSLEPSHRYSGGPCNLGAGPFGRVRVTCRARTGKVDDEFKKSWVTLHADEKLSGNCEIAMFEGVRNAVPMTQRMRTSKNDAEQANRLMIRQTLGYVSSRVRAASTVKAEET